MSEPISIVLVDDHALLRARLRRMLEDDPEIRVAGEAANGLEAVELVMRVTPRVVVMDLAMPVMDGIEATREIIKRAPDSLVLIISVSVRESDVRRAVEAGAHGYVVKNAADFDLGAAVKAVAAGEQLFDAAESGGVTERSLQDQAVNLR